MGARDNTKEGKTQRRIQGWVGRWSMTKYDQPWPDNNILEDRDMRRKAGVKDNHCKVGKILG